MQNSSRTKVKHTPPTPEQVRNAQKAAAEKEHAAVQANLPAIAPAVAVPALASADDYFNRNPGRMCVGRPIRPNLKLGRWIYADDNTDAPLPDGATYTVLYDMAWTGWVRLEAEQPPQYNGNFLFQGDYTRSSREELGDLDPALWPISQFDGEATDPWKEAVYLPLEQAPSGELVTIQIQSKPRSAAIFAIDGLLAHCRQLARRDSDNYPIVKLAIASYESRRFGSQYKPAFPIVGKTPKAGTGKSVDSSIATDMGEQLPF
jgi:hypothetical protein